MCWLNICYNVFCPNNAKGGGTKYIEQTINRTHPAEKEWPMGRPVHLQKGTQEHLLQNTRGGIKAVGGNYRIYQKRKLHSSKSAYIVFLADGMAAFLCQAIFTPINVHKL